MTRYALPALGLVLLATAVATAALPAPGDVGGMDRARAVQYIALAAAAGLAYLAAAWCVLHRPGSTLWTILAIGLALRAIAVATPPLLSTDIYRYVWDGRVQRAGFNPYAYLPADPALAALRDTEPGPTAIYPNINRADYAPTIYPPVAQALFAAVAHAWSSIYGIKAAMLACDLAAGALALALLRQARLPDQRLLLYAWNPLVVWEFAGGGHIDAGAVALGAGALLAAARLRPGLAGAALAGAVLCKLLPAALFPALWRRWDWRTPIVAAVLIPLAYAAFAGAGWRVLGFLPGYASEEGLGDGGGFWALRLLGLLGPLPHWAGRAYAACALLGLLALAVWTVRRPWPADPSARAIVISRDALWLTIALMITLSPHYPWYLTAIAIPATITPRLGAMWLMLSAPALYLDHSLGAVLWPALVFLPALAWLGLDLARSHGAR